jgi:P-type Cu2+ transporter
MITRRSDPHAGHNMSDIHGSHDRHAGHSVAMFRDKFWLSLAFTIPVVFWSTDVQHWLGYTAPSFPGSGFTPAIFGTVVFVYGGMVFIRGASSELADRAPGMMTLISLAIIVAFGTSLAATFGLFEIDVWWEVASLITIMILGHWLEMRAISQARGAPNALAALLPDMLNGYRAQTRNLCHSPSCALATSCLSGPEPAFRQTARSLRALPTLTSP